MGLTGKDVCKTFARKRENSKEDMGRNEVKDGQRGGLALAQSEWQL